MKKEPYIIHCPYCGWDISNTAKTCPHCGGKVKKVNVWKIISIILILIIVTTTFLMFYAPIKMLGTVIENVETKQAEVVENNKVIYEIGQTASSDDIRVTVTKAEVWTDYNEFFKPTTGYEIYRIYMEVENISTSDIATGYPNCYADNANCEMYLYAEDSYTFDIISMGRKCVGWVYYEVPIGAETIELEYETDFWFDDYVTFRIK